MSMSESELQSKKINPEIAFPKAYNDFDPKPLEGTLLDTFYVEEFSQSSIEELLTTIKITEKYRKLLVVGHRGCGKSTILNKVCNKLNTHTVVSFSAADVVNISEIEAIDILLATYFKILEETRILEEENAEKIRKEKKEELELKYLYNKSVEIENRKNSDVLSKQPGKPSISVPVELEPNRVPNYYKMTESFRELLKKLSIPIDLTETSVSLLGLISFKYKVEPETRSDFRFKLKGEVKQLQQNIYEACNTLKRLSNKEILIVIDDLDKLTSDVAKNIFFENYFLLSDIPAKVIYTFPLDVYYEPVYNKYSDLYEEIFIPLCNLTDIAGNERLSNKMALFDMVFKRIDKELVEPEALSYLVYMSGGLLRDLVKFMQEACKFTIMYNNTLITEDVAKKVVERKVNALDRVFDSLKYKDVIIDMERNRRSISKENLVYLLHNLFALEYREGTTDVWYIIHPCLKHTLVTSR